MSHTPSFLVLSLSQPPLPIFYPTLSLPDLSYGRSAPPYHYAGSEQLQPMVSS